MLLLRMGTGYAFLRFQNPSNSNADHPMAILRQPATPPSDKELPLIFNNGDYQALKAAAERLGFRDEESLLRFALAVLSKSSTRTLTITDLDGKSVALTASPGLLKETTPPNPVQLK
jgi:hypothetical protein